MRDSKYEEVRKIQVNHCATNFWRMKVFFGNVSNKG